MLDRLAARIVALARRLGRIERRELVAIRRWIEDTDNLRHLTVVLAVPLLIALVTALSDAVNVISFLLFPPLASGTYTLFADPEGRYSSPRRFVGGLTAGAVSGWLALDVAGRFVAGPPGEILVSPQSAALAVFLTAVVTWGLDLELPTAFSTALLVLTTGTTKLAYVAGMVLSAILVAGAFVVWRDRFYERRARYLYGAVQGDDHVLVPVQGGDDRPTVALAARLAGAHEAGKVVLLDVVDDDRIAAAERAVLADREVSRDRPTGETADADRDGDGTAPGAAPSDGEDDAREAATRRVADEAAAGLERQADWVREVADVPCEVVVATGDPVRTTLTTAREAGCDLVAASIDPDAEELSPLVSGVFAARIDAVALRSAEGRSSWRRVLVLVSPSSGLSHAMVDFAERLVDGEGRVSLCSCIDAEVERRRAESRLADLAETAWGRVETRVSRSSVDEFLRAFEGSYDLVVVGSSGERSRASRLVAPPTYRRIAALDLACDVLVVD
ncbi:MAG: HPP family protein [Haloferacaceae archaeon]